jgi:glycosyltransferase involved in cell wall biosynthesis
VAVVVPAYNEARLIARTLRSVPAWVDHVIVVDDASEDGTFDRVRELAEVRVMLLRHDTNRGVGAAIATGYRAAFGAGAEVAVVMAGDAQMDPADLPALVAPVIAGEADYAKGDRLSHPGARGFMPVKRWLGNHVLTVLTRFATGLRVRDSQCGYTAIARVAAERIRIEALWPRYGYPNDLLGRIAAAGLRVRDVRVRPIYADEASGIGWRHALFVVPWVLGRVLVRRLRSRPRIRADVSSGRVPLET